MYRSRNKNKTNGIKGPNSALTQFLQEEGISAEAIKQRWNDNYHKRKDKEGKEDTSLEEIDLDVEPKKGTPVDDIKAEESISSSSGEETETDDEAVAKRGRSQINHDSDEEEYDESSPQIETPLKSPDASKLSALKKAKNRKLLENRRKRKKRAEDLLDRREAAFPTLQDICLEKITENIISWENDSIATNNNPLFAKLRDTLGGISNANLDSLAKALSKNRALNDSTLQLFLKTDLKSLTFHDCSKISYEGYKILVIFSPHLESLTLNMCGQLNNEALLYIAEKLPNLKSLTVDGPFLINEQTWNEFFKIMSGRLKEFNISNTHRITDNNLTTLLSTSQNVLECLGLSRLDSISNYSIIPQYLQCPTFHTLRIEYPYNEEDVTDEVIIIILGQVGHSLKTLSLDGCLELTDSFVINGIGGFLSGNNNVNTLLESLSLGELDQLTSDSLTYVFSQISFPCLKTFSIRRCLQLEDAVVQELLLNSAKNSLVNINLNSAKKLTDQAFTLIECPNLEYMDLGFVRCVDNKIIELLGKQNPKLKLLDVFGDNRITDTVQLRDGLTMVGLQSDSI